MSIIDLPIEGNLDSVKYGQLRLDKELNIVSYTDYAKEFYGSIHHANFIDLAYDDDSREEYLQFFQKVEVSGEARAITFTRDRYEKPRLIDLSGNLVPEEDSCIDIVFWDITNMEASFFFSHENIWKYRMMLGMSDITCFDYKMDINQISFFRYVTRKSIRLYLDTFEQFEKDIRALSDSDSKNMAAIEQLCNQLKSGANSLDLTIKTGLLHKDHKMQKLRIRARYDTMNQRHFMYGIIMNMAADEDDVPYYMTAAGLDPMTGLLNKRSLVEYTEDTLLNPANSNRHHYMILLDIDDFKEINDNLGHQAGDQAIQILATTLTDTVNDLGIIGRFGGDEFYILTDRIQDEEDLRRMLRTIRTTANRRVTEALGLDSFTLSMGVALYPDVGRTYKELFTIADKSLYIAKEKGKNRYIIYRPEMHENLPTGGQKKGSSSYDEQAKSIHHAVHELFHNQVSAIPNVLSDIIKGFDLDSIDVFYGDGLKVVYNEGKYPSGFTSRDFFSEPKYMELFDDNGLFVMGSLNNLKNPIPQIYRLLQEKHCMSMIQLVLPSVSEAKYMISFNLLNRVHKWSDSEISNLNLIGSLIFDTLEAEKSGS